MIITFIKDDFYAGCDIILSFEVLEDGYALNSIESLGFSKYFIENNFIDIQIFKELINQKVVLSKYQMLQLTYIHDFREANNK